MNIKTELEALTQLLLDKGCASPDLQFLIRANSEFRGEVNYYPDENYVGYQSKYFDDATEEGALRAMRQHIYAIPSIEERRRQEYLKKLGAVIEYGKRIGLDDHFINPLELQMKKLSGNIIEHKREPETPDHQRAPFNGEIPF